MRELSAWREYKFPKEKNSKLGKKIKVGNKEYIRYETLADMEKDYNNRS